jgi:hypothetical protein
MFFAPYQSTRALSGGEHPLRGLLIRERLSRYKENCILVLRCGKVAYSKTQNKFRIFERVGLLLTIPPQPHKPKMFSLGSPAQNVIAPMDGFHKTYAQSMH